MKAKIIIFGNKISCGATQGLYKIINQDAFRARMQADGATNDAVNAYNASKARYGR